MTTTLALASTRWAPGEDRSGYQAGGQSFSSDFWVYVKATEGCAPHAFIDPTFAANWAKARQEGKRRGAYHFFHPSMSPVDQAHLFWSVVAAQEIIRGDFLVADIEITSGVVAGTWTAPEPLRRSHLAAVSGPDLSTHPLYATPPLHAGVSSNAARIFLDTLAGLAGPHHAILVYSNLSVAATLGNCTGYPLIIAYPSRTPPASVSPWPSFHAWQYEFGGGQGGGDKDLWAGDEAEMDAWIAGWADPHKPPPPPPKNWTEIIMQELPTLGEGANDAVRGGRYVHRIQALLCAMGHAVKMDGIYGPATKAAVEALQSAHGIGVDGVTGKDTWSVLLTGAPLPATA